MPNRGRRDRSSFVEMRGEKMRMGELMEFDIDEFESVSAQGRDSFMALLNAVKDQDPSRLAANFRRLLIEELRLAVAVFGENARQIHESAKFLVESNAQLSSALERMNNLIEIVQAGEIGENTFQALNELSENLVRLIDKNKSVFSFHDLVALKLHLDIADIGLRATGKKPIWRDRAIAVRKILISAAKDEFLGKLPGAAFAMKIVENIPTSEETRLRSIGEGIINVNHLFKYTEDLSKIRITLRGAQLARNSDFDSLKMRRSLFLDQLREIEAQAGA